MAYSVKLNPSSFCFLTTTISEPSQILGDKFNNLTISELPSACATYVLYLSANFVYPLRFQCNF